jgi:hypothetical protein
VFWFYMLYDNSVCDHGKKGFFFFSLMKNISLYALCQLSLIFLYLLPNRVSEVLWSQFSTFTIDQ